MYYVKTDRPFEFVESRLHELFPEVELNHVVTDYALKELGFVDRPPCVFTFDLTEEKIEEIMDTINDFDIAYCMDERSGEDNPGYESLIRYWFLWDLFYEAEWVDTVEDIFK